MTHLRFVGACAMVAVCTLCAMQGYWSLCESAGTGHAYEALIQVDSQDAYHVDCDDAQVFCYRVRLKNRTSSWVRVSHVSAQCDCTRAAVSPQVIAPGDNAVLTVDYDVSSQKGVLLPRAVDIEYTALEMKDTASRMRCVLSGKRERSVEVSPPLVDFGRHLSNTVNEVAGRILLRGRMRARTIPVEQIGNNTHCVRILGRHALGASEDCVEFLVSNRPGQALGKFHTELAVALDRQGECISIPIAGESVSPLSVHPRVVLAGYISRKASYEALCRVAYFDKDREISLGVGEFSADCTEECVAASSCHDGLQLRLNPGGLRCGPFESRIAVSTTRDGVSHRTWVSLVGFVVE